LALQVRDEGPVILNGQLFKLRRGADTMARARSPQGSQSNRDGTAGFVRKATCAPPTFDAIWLSFARSSWVFLKGIVTRALRGDAGVLVFFRYVFSKAPLDTPVEATSRRFQWYDPFV
jgi:hypothetical protein